MSLEGREYPTTSTTKIEGFGKLAKETWISQLGLDAVTRTVRDTGSSEVERQVFLPSLLFSSLVFQSS